MDVDGIELLKWCEVSDRFADPPQKRIVIQDPKRRPKGQPEQYEDSNQCAHVLVTRYALKRARAHPNRLTILSACEPKAIERVMETLTDTRSLFRVVTAGELGKDTLDRSRAPAVFQIVFEVPRLEKPELAPGPTADWGFPRLRLAVVLSAA
jgi:hypothetical protein